jgi:hypothetical protein
MTDPHSLAIFAKVVEASGISEAARRLQMSISTVRRRIADLKNQFGVCLLERSTRNTGDRSLRRRANHQDPCHCRRHLFVRSPPALAQATSRRGSPAHRSAGNSSPIKPPTHAPFASAWPKKGELVV